MMERISEREDKKKPVVNNQTTAVGFPIKTSSPIVSLNEVLNNFLPQGHEKVIRNAFFNTITICSVLLVSFTLVAVYFVLQPFLRPLLWSLLAGSFLFPFKYRLTRITRNWFDFIRDNNKTIAIESVSLPFQLFNWCMDAIIGVMIDYCKLLMAIFASLLTIHLMMFYFRFTHTIILAIKFAFNLLLGAYTFLQSPSNAVIILTLAFAHLLLTTFCWNEGSRKYLIAVSPIIWISVICQLISFMGTIGLLIVVGALLLTSIGVITSIIEHRNTSNNRTNETHGDDTSHDEPDSIEPITSVILSLVSMIWSFIKSLLPLHRFTHYYHYTVSADNSFEDHYDVVDESQVHSSPIIRPKIEEESAGDLMDTPTSPILNPNMGFSRRESLPNFTQDSLLHPAQGKPVPLSNVYIYALLWSCCLAYIWMNPTILLLLPIPMAVCAIRWMWRRFYLPQAVIDVWENIVIWFEERQAAFIHPSLKTTLRYMVTGDKTLAELLSKSVDTLCSLTVILTVLVAMLLAAAFLTFQIYGESIHLVNVVGNIVNSTLANHPEFNALFSENTTSNITFFDEMIGNAYLYGRKWLKKSIRSVLNVESDESSLNASIAIERQLLEVWDRSYQMWLTRDEDSDDQTTGLIKPKYINTGDYDWNILVDAFKTLNFSLCFNVFKENLDTVMSVMESLWLVLKGNLTLFFSAFWAIISLLLSGSSAILNGLLNFIVFSTSLFYLLSASENQYKPIEWASKLIPATETAPVHPRSRRSQNKFVRAMNEGINSVFAASFKMTTFYGLYTWLIHTLFQARLIYMPSVTAAMLGAVPFIGSYWASFPAVLELWLVHGLQWKALLMFTCSILPMYVVDSEIYAEIKGGGHPYLTGLAIAGGIFFLGIEGAIFGPILLCCLFVAMNIYTSIMNDTSQHPVVGAAVQRKVFKRMNSTLS